MSIIFLGLACDEFLGFHEGLNDNADLSGITPFSWIAFGMGFAFIFAFIFFRTVVQLPSPIRRLVLLAGLIYLSGAIGMETLNGAFVPVGGHEGMRYVLCAATEEFLEMIGIVVFIYALLTYLVQGRREVALALEFMCIRTRARSTSQRMGEEDRSLEDVPVGNHAQGRGCQSGRSGKSLVPLS